MIFKKSEKVNYDDIASDDLSDKAEKVLHAIVDLHNSGEEAITNKKVSEKTGYSLRQVVGIVNGITKRDIIKRDKMPVMVEKKVTVFRIEK